MSRCICPRIDLGDGEERIEWPDPDCPEHGRGDEWRAGDPLRKYRRTDGFRIETPREVEERLRREMG